MKKTIFALIAALALIPMGALQATAADGEYTKEEIQYLTQAAERGDAESQYLLYECYIDGKGVKQDGGLACKWLVKAAGQGYPPALYMVSLLFMGDYFEDNDQDALAKANDLLRQAAEKGYARAQLTYGLHYKNGLGVPKNIFIAVNWLQKSAEQGYSRAQCELGICYEEGHGVSKNLPLAINLYRQSVDQGDMFAQYRLGLCYETGKGVSKNISIAIDLYRMSAAQGNTDAQKRLQELGEK